MRRSRSTSRTGGASEVLLSVRTPPGIVRRDTLGVPSQLLGIASMHLPTGVVDRIAAGIRRVAILILRLTGSSLPRGRIPSSSSGG